MILLNDISFVIPSNRSIEENRTITSVPSECEIIIPRSYPLGKARNDGIRQATRRWIILCDDDIFFSSTFLNLLSELANERRIIGLEGYFPSPFIIGRLMMFSKATWIEIGEFDDRAHGDETEWCLRGVKKGYEILRLSRSCVYHYLHQKGYKPKTELLTLLYLFRKHPTFPLYIIKLIAQKIKQSSYDEEYFHNKRSL